MSFVYRTKQDIITLFQVLQHEDLSFHPDRKFEDYVDRKTGAKKYSETEIALRMAMLQDSRKSCETIGLDFYQVYKEACLRVDLKTKLTEYFPILFELLGDQPLSWKKINDQFSSRHLTRLTNYIRGDRELLEANFYDIISAALNEEPKGIRMLTFFRRLLEELADRLDVNGKKKIKKTLYNMLMEPDLNYLNYVGELAVLNLFIHDNVYMFVEIESPLGNGNEADFEFRSVATGGQLLIEVVNIRPEEFPTDPPSLKRFVEGKLSEKIQKKTKGDPAYLKFRLLPVIWGTVKELQWTAALLKGGLRFDAPGVIDPCAFCTFGFRDQSGTVYKFGSLYSMF